MSLCNTWNIFFRMKLFYLLQDLFPFYFFLNLFSIVCLLRVFSAISSCYNVFCFFIITRVRTTMCEGIVKILSTFTFFSVTYEILLRRGSFETELTNLFNSMLIYFLIFNRWRSSHFDINVINLILFHFPFPSYVTVKFSCFSIVMDGDTNKILI